MAITEYSDASSVETERNRYYDNTEIIDGVRYSTKESNDTLSNSDFYVLKVYKSK